MIQYVAGFQLDPSLERVLLIQKRKPAWQAGKLNEIGGHIEPGETADQAMVREFAEETGLPYAADLHWARFGVLIGEDDSWKVFWYWAVHPLDIVQFREGPTEEQLFGANVSDVLRGGCPATAAAAATSVGEGSVTSEFTVNCIPNLRWLLPMAINCVLHEDRCSLFRVHERRFEL